MSKTQAEKQKDYRDRRRQEGVDRRNSNAPVTERDANSNGNARNAPDNVTRVTDNVDCIDVAKRLAANTVLAIERGSVHVFEPTMIPNGPHYATRTNPDKLNYGQHMTGAELETAGLSANRVPIPGDHDYVGCCVKADKVWAVA